MLTGFLLVLILSAVGVGLTIIWVGLPLLVAALLTARGFATAERRILAQLFNHEPAAMPYKPPRQESSWFRSMVHPITDPQCWLDFLWLFVGFIVSVPIWGLSVLWVALCSLPVLGPIGALINEIFDGTGLTYLLTVEIGSLPLLPTHSRIIDAVVYIVVGLFAIKLAPAIFRGLAGVTSSLSDALLNAMARNNAQIHQLRDSRAAGQRAETGALRKLERDIHDGPQQRLVRLNMDLARTRRQMDQNPDRAQEMLGEAMAQTQETLAELRQLSRGIAPPVLMDRGLEAAIDETAARSTIPVTVYSSIPGKLPDHVEQTAYFVISESLVNANKHSGATTIDLITAVQDGWLYTIITDNGTGGASTAKGHGLAGLEERLRGVDGQLLVTSPVGGPTTIEAVVPCEF
jgi:two-component system sensor kinase